MNKGLNIFKVNYTFATLVSSICIVNPDEYEN